jgi:hypothetical protein
MKNFLALMLLTIALSTQLLGGTRDPLTPDEKYLEYAKDFHYVVSICGIHEDNTLFCGSAVAISPRIILTAAHVVKNSKHCGIHINDSEIILIEDVMCHKDFDGKFGEADIAICRLSKDLELTFYPTLYTDNDEVGKLCCMAGYGSTGTFLTGQTISDGKRRAGSNRIDGIEKDLLLCSPSKTIERGRTSLEFIICSGDSGGGLFIDGKLAGINSCVFAVGKPPLSTYGEESGHTRISKFAPWILENKEALEKKKDVL